MRWNVLKSGRRSKKPSLRAYEERFLVVYSEDEPKKILEKETKRSLAVVAGIRDQGLDERNRLKAANTLLDRILPRMEKLGIEGSLSLEAKLTEALERSGGDKNPE